MNSLFSARHLTRRAVLPAALVTLTASGALVYSSLNRPALAQQAATPSSAAEAAQALVGKPAPDFTLSDQNDKAHSLDESKGKWVVLAFYPADKTTGCTFQNKSYTQNLDKFAPLNAVVYTVSTQDTASKKEFCSSAGLKHTLLADVGGKVANQYGVLNGKYARRYTYYIAPDGTIAGVDTKINTNQAGPDSLAMLAKLQANAPETSAPADPAAPPAGGETRTTTGGQTAVTEASPNVFVGAAKQKVVMGSVLPDWGLPNAATGKQTGFSTLSAGKKATVLVWVSTQCPVSNAYNARMAQLAANYAPKGVQFVGINSNVTENNAKISAHAKQNGLTFPILKDATDKIADQFGAQVTPEVFVADARGVLVYHGPIDDSQEVGGVTKKYLASALDSTLAGQPVAEKSVRAFGCAIKRGN